MNIYIYMHHDHDVITWTNRLAYTTPESAYVLPQGHNYIYADSGVVYV